MNWRGQKVQVKMLSKSLVGDILIKITEQIDIRWNVALNTNKTSQNLTRFFRTCYSKSKQKGGPSLSAIIVHHLF